MESSDAGLPVEEQLDLENAYHEMMEEQAAMVRLENRLLKLMTEAAFEEFPALKNMSSEDLRKFDDRRHRFACHFAAEVASFAYRAEREQETP